MNDFRSVSHCFPDSHKNFDYSDFIVWLEIDMDLKHGVNYHNIPLLLAATTLGASLLPFCDYGGMSVSLIGIYGIVTQVQQAMAGLADAGAILGDGGSISGGALTASLNILLLLYLVPVGGAVVIYFELTGRAATHWARLSGLASMVLPLLLPYIAWETFRAFLPDDIRSMIGPADAGSMGLNSGIGLWTIVLLGTAQTVLSFRRGTSATVKMEP